MMSTPEEGTRLPLGTWIGFAAMCLGMFMAVLDIQVVATSLPAISDALAIAPDQMSWVQTAYLIAEVVAIALTGLLTRALGMRALFTVAICLFTLSSIACAASTGFATLVTARVAQGLTGGMLIPLVFSSVFLLFPLRQQGPATTLAGMLAVLAPVVGPVVGGWITQSYSWHWLFLINVVPGIVAGTVGLAVLAGEGATPALLRRLDIGGLALLAFALASLEIGLKQAPSDGWRAPLVLALLAGSAFAAALFIHRSIRASNDAPVIHFEAFRARGFAIGCALSFLLGICLFGSVYLLPVFLALVRGKEPLAIGLIMLVTGATQFVTAPLAVALERRLAPGPLTLAGFALFGIGLAMSASAGISTDFDGLFWPQVARGAAIMLCLLPPTRLALGSLPPEQVPDASALFNLMRNLGGAVGIALVDTVMFGRAPSIGQSLRERLLAGDTAAALVVGIPPDLLPAPGAPPPGPEVEAFVRPLVEKAALAQSIGEAWLLLAGFAFAGAALALAMWAMRRVEARSQRAVVPL